MVLYKEMFCNENQTHTTKQLIYSKNARLVDLEVNDYNERANLYFETLQFRCGFGRGARPSKNGCRLFVVKLDHTIFSITIYIVANYWELIEGFA